MDFGTVLGPLGPNPGKPDFSGKIGLCQFSSNIIPKLHAKNRQNRWSRFPELLRLTDFFRPWTTLVSIFWMILIFFEWSRFFRQKRALPFFSGTSKLTSGQKSEKSIEPFSRTFDHLRSSNPSLSSPLGGENYQLPTNGSDLMGPGDMMSQVQNGNGQK